MSVDLVLRSRRVLTPDGERPAAVLVGGPTVAGVAAYDVEVPGARSLLLGDDEVLLPGLVDTHVHVNEPGRTDWEGFASATRAAAAGGVTTIIDMPLNSIPPTTSVAALDIKRVAAVGRCSVDVGFWGGAVPGNAAELPRLLAAGAFGAKAFLAPSGVPEFPACPPEALAAAAAALRPVDGLLLVHAEDPAGLREPAPGRAYAGLLAARPAAAEVAAVAQLVALAQLTGVRVHVVHLSAADALPLLAAAKKDGVPVSAETCPHYLTLAAEEIPDGATAAKCCPPIRSAANRDLLWAGLVDGTIDAVVSDHSPSPPELKAFDTGDFAAAWGGIASLQLGLPVVWTAARRRGIGLGEVVSWMSTGPARLAGLTGKGRIAPGMAADFAVFAPEQEWTVDPTRLAHRHPITPYAGRRITGMVRATWLGGRPVEGPPRGRLLRRGEP